MTNVTGLSARGENLLSLGRFLQDGGYCFTTVSPASHERVNARPQNQWARSVEDVFGWSRPFRKGLLPQRLVDLLQAAGELHEQGEGLRSTIRASTLEGALFFHSAYPTAESDAVFFGPDTYRFAAAIAQHLAAQPVRRAVDIGCGAGPGAVLVALARPGGEVLAVDINDKALDYTRVNAALAGTANVITRRSNLLDSVDGTFDLIIANPPYLLDQDERVYRHGGGGLGEGLSVSIAELAGSRLSAGGMLLLYTGSAVCAGVDRFRALVTTRLHAAGLEWRYSEIDPDVFGEELLEPTYAGADRIAAVLVIARRRDTTPASPS